MRVNDRGPHKKGRIIDLSYGAAKALGMLSQGIAMVELERVDSRVPYRDETETGLPDFEFDIGDIANAPLVMPFPEFGKNTDVLNTKKNTRKKKQKDTAK